MPIKKNIELTPTKKEVEVEVDEKYVAPNHVPTWEPESGEPVTWEVDESHNLPTVFDPDAPSR